MPKLDSPQIAQLDMFADSSDLNARPPPVEYTKCCDRSTSEQAAFEYAQSKGAELPDLYILPYGLESRYTASMRSITRADYEDSSKPDANGSLPDFSFRVLCEKEVPMSGWFKSEVDARKFAEGYNIRHFRTIGNSSNPKNPLRI